MEGANKDVDYCGIIFLLRQLVAEGQVSHLDARKIASRIAGIYGINIILSV